jgi:hypothetical protein
MAQIVLGIGTSHSPMLATAAEDYPKHAEIDRSGRKLIDKNGVPHSFGELAEMAGDTIADQIRPQVLEERAARCTANVEKLGQVLESEKLDSLIIIGDDQHEQFFDDNMPSILIYSGETILNNPLNMAEDAPDWWRKARQQYHVDAASIEYPVDAKLAGHLTNFLMDRDFDISHAKRLGREHGEGHAFGFVHQRLMDGGIIPIVPVALNTYFPPNQPRPRRCYDLGRAIAEAVRAWPRDARIGILGSGGLSHFTVNEELDRGLLDAFKRKDADWLRAISPAQINSGTSEVRNWLVVAGACEHLDTQWQDYVPCYRSLAGTGCGMGFAIWS